MLDAHHLGATLYVPATHPALPAIVAGEKYPFLRSVVLCPEDAVAERELPAAMDNLAQTLAGISRTGPLCFVRPRHPDLLGDIVALPGAAHLTGFVLPKFTRHNLPDYWQHLNGTAFRAMPTLETREVFDASELVALREALLSLGEPARILALRIGGNDLLALMGIRRPRHLTLYDTPLGLIVKTLVTLFKPWGFELTAPVFEHLDAPDILAQEVLLDLAHGLAGKTAIHPEQVALIERHYRVEDRDLFMAQRILASDSPAVFRAANSMCEVATHADWARDTLCRAQRFGASAVSPLHLD